MDVGGLYGKIVTNVVVVPLVVVIICYLMFEAQRRSLNVVVPPVQLINLHTWR